MLALDFQGRGFFLLGEISLIQSADPDTVEMTLSQITLSPPYFKFANVRMKTWGVKNPWPRKPSVKEKLKPSSKGKLLMAAFIGPVTPSVMGLLTLYKKMNNALSFFPTHLYEFITCGDPPGLYSEIGKDIRAWFGFADILYEDHSFHKFLICYPPFCSNVTLNEQDQVLGEVSLKPNLKSLTSDLRFRSNNTVLMSTTIKEVAPGLAPGLSFISSFNALNNGKVELKFLHKYANLNASLGFLTDLDFLNPI
ncbi:unnamed protein product [Arabis nemorensis]|uniref:Uncharacterized protein n=1 Tax=Arabis nemorensis TaxID=586526 RepID=A0A565B6A7_9BRAS|nr:unnamed protein product [Arabis nemorensis]